MPSDSDILQAVQQACAQCRRPEHFTNYTHCCECAEHDETLRRRDLDSLRIEDVGHAGWDPICFITVEGFTYYLPALIRLALAEPVEPYDWYGVQLLFHLCYEGRQNRRLLSCTPAQRHAVLAFLHHLVETRAGLVDAYGRADDLFQAIEIWSEQAT